TMNAAFGMRIEVLPGDLTIPEGGDVQIAATVDGPVPEEVVIEYEDVEEADGEGSEPNEPVRMAMHPAQDDYKAVMRNVVGSRMYRVTATGSSQSTSFLAFRSAAGRTAVSKTYRIDTHPPPRLERLRVETTFPDYFGREAEIEDPATGDLKAPVGTVVTMVAEANKPLAEAGLSFGEESLGAEVDGTEFTLTFAVEKSFSYRFALKDDQGFENVNDVYHSITAVPDKAPSVAIVSPEGDVSVGPKDLVPLVFRAEDDYGLARVEVCMARGQETEPKVLQSYLGGG
ncbi:MAG: DUF4175 domain-containing protein, partial [bacterium]|nr:DUF4175 domain-containing protein [bacterium]